MDKQTNRKTDTQMNRKPDKQTNRKIDKQTNRQIANRQKQTDKETTLSPTRSTNG